MSREPVDEELVKVEAWLRSLDLAASRLDFAETMFLAGRASATAERSRPVGRHGLWPWATTVSAVAALAFASLWAARGGPPVVERVVYETERPQVVQAQAASPAANPTAGATGSRAGHGDQAARNWQEYAELRRLTLRQELGGLPEVQWRSSPDRRPIGWDRLDDPALRQLLGG
jgi:hypothetical protein